MKKIIRVTTIAGSLGGLLTGQLRFMNSFYKVIGIATGCDLLEKVGARENIDTIAVEMTRKITPFKDLKSVYTLYKIFKKEKPFIVHSHTPKAGTTAMIAAKLAKVPHRLHTIAGLPLVEATGMKRVLLNTVEKITYASATKIYPNSYGLQDIILENKFTNLNKLKVIGEGSTNGINTSHFDTNHFTDDTNDKLKKSLGIKSNDLVFIFVGRLVKDKGINELITAFKKLNNSHYNIKLLLVGSYEKELDPVLPKTEKIIEQNKNILSVGWQTDVRPYFAIADILTFPSYREGFPNVVMQANAMGLFAIVTNINGCNEIVIEGKNGTIIPVKNTEALYKKMEMSCNKSFSYCSDTCRKLITERYEQQYIWNEILKEYQSLENS